MRVQAPRFDPQALSVDALDELIAIEQDIYEFPWTFGNFRDSIAAGYRSWAVRTEPGELYAYAVVMSVADEAHLLNLSIARAWQSLGMGRRLLEFLLADARSHSAARILLEVRPSNAAGRRLYGSSGFVEIGVRRGYYPAAVGREDALVLALDL